MIIFNILEARRIKYFLIFCSRQKAWKADRQRLGESSKYGLREGFYLLNLRLSIEDSEPRQTSAVL